MNLVRRLAKLCGVPANLSGRKNSRPGPTTHDPAKHHKKTAASLSSHKILKLKIQCNLNVQDINHRIFPHVILYNTIDFS